MSDLPTGRYSIVPARRSAPPPFPIGAAILEEGSSPVISAGNINVWTVERFDSGNYTLSLGVGESWFSKGDQDNVVVIPDSAVAGFWTIRKRESGVYTSVPYLNTFR
ncbi:hypothetical protein JVT61DRAFT_11321 [Boletus reticuloceps]|uniref:Uncharacterized protein n=1 Tax=Boletus reticuloceps TaxID=495285 RepID=A0A8I3A4N6_9AGAM|nr:hypothetical protein JVT61DRAFT_11321 [Boletus reticuloceps]